MAIIERDLGHGRWERKATGQDIPKLVGSLKEYGNEKYKEAFHKNEGQYERITDPSGRETAVRKDQVDLALAQGYGRAAVSMRMTVPELPWPKKRLAPGKHKFKYDKATNSMVEVG